MSSRLTCACCALMTIAVALPTAAAAQSNPQNLPPITVEGQQARRPAANRAARHAAPAPQPAQEAAPAAPNDGSNTPGASLTLPNVEQARRAIDNTPGAVSIVTSDDWRDQKTSNVKDMFDYTPGVWAQPKWGEDARLSIRGSGLSRNFHGRSLQLFMDGIPINTADGYFDLQEIDPSAYRYAEVFRGAAGLRYGANSMFGAINFVTPSGRNSSPFAASSDVGAFNYRRLQSSSGGQYGPVDYFVTGSWQAQDGFRDHSNGELYRGFGNLGYQIAPNVETRFYFNGNNIEQQIPGSVTKNSALNQPRTPAWINVQNDWQRNISSNRVANKTSVKFDNTTLEFGAYSTNRHLMHPIFQWLDYNYDDYGGFGRLVDDRKIFGFRNRLVAGINALNGEIDNRQFSNNPSAIKGGLLSWSNDRSRNSSAYVENSFYFLPNMAAVVGTQYLRASRERIDLFLSDGNQGGMTNFSIWSPKYGLLWDLDAAATAQVYANISRSAEVPSFGESSAGPGVPFIPFWNIQAQTATTYEVGTRGKRPDLTWDIAIYRMEIQNELQCLYSAFGNCNVTNANRTVHQGFEFGLGAAVWKQLFVAGANPDKLWLQVAYTYNNFYFDEDPVFGNNKLPGAPPQYMRAELLYKHPSGWFVGPNVEYVPQPYFVDSINSMTVDPYMLWGLRGGFDDGKNFSFYVEGRNLSDRTYVSSVSIINVANPQLALFDPGSGRAVFAGAKYKW
ncbi:MAG: TonB-dependent receptor [Pseudorhodoplanes sp.]